MLILLQSHSIPVTMAELLSLPNVLIELVVEQVIGTSSSDSRTGAERPALARGYGTCNFQGERQHGL